MTAIARPKQNEQIEKRSNKQIAIASILNIVLIVIDIASGLFFIPWFIRSLGNSNYAIYSLSISIVNLFIIDFGLDSAVNRYIAKYKAAGDKEGLDSFLSTIYKLFLILSAIIAALLIVFYFLIEKVYVGLSPQEIINLKNAYIITGFFSIIVLPCQPFNGVLNAHEEFIFLKVSTIVQKVLYVVVAILILKLTSNLMIVVLWHSSSMFILTVAKYVYMRCKTHLKANFKLKFSKTMVKEILSFTLWTTIVSIADRIVVSFSSSILGIVGNSDNIAAYSIAVTIESYAYLIGSVIGGFFIAKISRIQEEKDEKARAEKMTHLFTAVSHINAILIFLIFVGFAICGKRFLAVWLHGTYNLDSYYCALLLIVPQLVYTPTQVVYSGMVVDKKLKPLAITTIIACVVNVGLAFLLGKFFGVIGVSLAFCLCQTGKQIAFCFLYKKYLSFDHKYFFKKTYIGIAIISVITTVFGLVMNSFLPEGGMLNLFKLILCVAAFYFALLLCFGFTKQEKDLMKRFVR